MNTFTNVLTVEWAPFQVAAHITDDQLIEAANGIEQDFLQKQQGYIRRELLKGKDNQWVDLVYWASPAKAALAAQAANDSEACAQYFSLMVGVENAEEGISHYAQVKSWK